MLLVICVAVIIGFNASNSTAQSTGPAALAAKQAVKDQVVSALGDGKITENERRSILVNAKSVCSEKEYLSLLATLNRLSPPEYDTPENLGHTPYVDKQMMARFPSGDLPYLNKSTINKAFPGLLFAKETMPRQNYTTREFVDKQNVQEERLSRQTAVKTATPKSYTIRDTTPIQSTAKTKKSSATSKVVKLPPPPLQNNNQPLPSTVGEKENITSESDEPAPPMPPVPSKTWVTAAKKPMQQKEIKSSKKTPVIDNRATIQQPAVSWNTVDKPSIKHSYTDYSVPVLITPAAALLTIEHKDESIKATFDEFIEPDLRQDIIRQQ